jgi:hypothetical protein
LPLAAIGLMAGVLSSLAVAADLNVPAKSPSTSLKDFLAGTPDCVEATDQCRVCLVSGADNVSCSNVGIACSPQSWSCTSKRTETPSPAPTPAGDHK